MFLPRHIRSRICRNVWDESEIHEELSFHIEMRTRDNIEAGMQAEEARKSAVLSFGDPQRVQKTCSQIKRRYRAARIASATRSLSWPLGAYGLVLRLNGSGEDFSHIGTVLIMIALLLRLLIFLHLRSPHLKADAKTTPLSVDLSNSGQADGPYILDKGARDEIASMLGRPPKEAPDQDDG